MKFLITGGTGFLGSYVCRKLLSEDNDVVCYDYVTDMNSIQQVLTEEELSRVKCVQGDVRDYDHLLETCRAEKIDAIIHLAGLLKDACDKDVMAAVQTNLAGTVNMFEAARTSGIKRVVWASSSSAVGSPEHEEGEKLPNDVYRVPQTVYGKIKDTCEFLGEFYNKKYGLETVGLRYVSIYGKARMRGGSNWINALMIAPAKGEPSVLPCGGYAPNVVYVKDAAEATVLAATVPADRLTRPAYYVSGDRRPLEELRNYVVSLLPEADIRLEEGFYEVYENYDTSLEERDLGYKPEYDAFKGARETINLIRSEEGLPLV